MTRFARFAPALVLVLAACGDNTHGGAPDAAASKLDARSIDAAPVAIDAAPPLDAFPQQVWPAPGAVPLTTPDQTFWAPLVTIGSQQFVLDLDTGSTTTGVASTVCSGCRTDHVSPLYAPGSGATDQHHTTQTEYADGTGWSGEVYKDVVNVGGGTPDLPLVFGEMTAENQFFDLGDNVYQGIIGMGPSENASDRFTESFVDGAVSNGMIATMAFELCDTGGTMWLGGFDQTHASAPPAYTPLEKIDSRNGFYSLQMTGMTIGTTSVGTGSTTFENPIVDTGTTNFFLPTKVDTAILAAVNASPGWTTLFGTQKLTTLESNGCVTAAGVTSAMVDAALPPMTMTMPGTAAEGGLAITVSANPMGSYLQDAGNGKFCYTVGDGGTGDGTIMGDTILRAFITIIDRANKQIGFAPDSGCNGDNTLFQHRPVDRDHWHPHHPPRPRHRG